MGVVHLRERSSAIGDGWHQLKGEQGDLLGRPGRVRVLTKLEGESIRDLEIVGEAVPMLVGRIFP
jgi:predicted PhzF superfamily epimerase YddE/YHI9